MSTVILKRADLLHNDYEYPSEVLFSFFKLELGTEDSLSASTRCFMQDMLCCDAEALVVEGEGRPQFLG